MYLSHYKFNEKPFQITADPKFIWLGEKHAEALASFQYGLQDSKPILLLTGDVGTGKTALINVFLT
ncbi:MAG: type II secretory pathway protein, partial [Desulfobacterales bacterium]